VIINYLDLGGIVAVPAETDAPLVVYSDAVTVEPVAFQFL